MNDAQQPQVGCGNDRHPDGPWHPAAPLPFYGGSRLTKRGRAQRRAVRRYERNKERWGCGCDSDTGQRLIEAQNLLEQVHKYGTWTTPSAWNDQRKKFLAKL